MRKYLGSKIDAFSAVLLPLFAVCPLAFAAAALCSAVNPATVFLAALCVACAVFCAEFLFRNRKQLYRWGTFGKDAVYIREPFCKEYALSYDQCRSVGIGWYVHGTLNSRAGSNVWYIFFSREPFAEGFRFRLNQWKPTEDRVKVGFDMKLYRYLLQTLPEKQRRMLQKNFEWWYKN